MTTVTFDPKAYDISFKGHADYAEKGKDIVCSAVSILCYTLAEALEKGNFLMKIEKSIEEGECRVKAYPKPQYEANVQLVFFTILSGLTMLAEDYPDNVKVDII